jgi:hypothetical protein
LLLYHTTHISNDEARLEVTAYQEVVEVLSMMNQDFLEATASQSHGGSEADVGDSSGDNGSNASSSDDLFESESDSTKRAKVTVATAATGLTFNFGPSTIGKGRIQAMDILLRVTPRTLAQNWCLSPRVTKL